jgi:hypothetical protein
MVGPLKRLRRDPNNKGRGAGLYYHRGHGYYSKYSQKRDKRKHSRTIVKNIRMRHTGELSKRTWI